jgi:hypothetical protein
MWPFTRKRVVDAETAAWHVENFLWLLRQFGGNGDFAATKLVLPKPGFFTGDGEQGHVLAERIFNQVKDYCGMRGWEVDLAEDDNPLAPEMPMAPAMIAPPPRRCRARGVAELLAVESRQSRNGGLWARRFHSNASF